ncbi:MAG TPA: site-specific DNA-methyltransferase [Anaerolineales bacterium]|nr:site-specific DNA-methyltransferase [Anaerolineales bacterium]
MTRRKATSSSAFGSPGRISHDSRRFYERRLYEERPQADAQRGVETPPPPEAVNRIYSHSSEAMTELPDSCVHLMVTSPPYNAGKEYDEDLSLEEYRGLLQRVFEECRRVLVTGGRACINVANLGRKPYLPLHVYVIEDMLALGFLMRGEIIWNKASSASPSTAWGSWRSAANPVLRDVHEYILVFSKDSFSRRTAGRKSTIPREAFLEWTKSVWTFPAEPARKVGHPAPFPEELPRRLIDLYTFEGDLVLDPFCGSGTTCVAAARLDRSYIGYEVDPKYVRLAEKRLAESLGENESSARRRSRGR